MVEQFGVFWDWSDDGNLAHIAEHDVTPEEVMQVLGRGFADRIPSRSEPARWIARDYTDASRFLVVSFELEWVPELAGWGITPVTAFEPEEPL